MRCAVLLVCLANAALGTADAFALTSGLGLTARTSLANVGRETRGVKVSMTSDNKQVAANTQKVQDFLRRRQGSSKLAPAVVNPPPMPEFAKRQTLRSITSGSFNSFTDFEK